MSPQKGFTHESQARSVETVWLTPKWVIDRLGPFDLDPCAAPEPRPWATAAHHITLPEDGLMAPWDGLVWCNPPYGRQVGAWMSRMAMHDNGIALVFARTDTEWFQKSADFASGILFLKGRLQFCTPDGVSGDSASAPSLLMSFGHVARVRLVASGLAGVLWEVR